MILRATIQFEGDETLLQRIADHAKSRGEKLHEFYTRAIINQMENDGDFEVRDLIPNKEENKYAD